MLEAEYSILPPSPCGALCSFYTDFWTLFQWRIWLLLTIKINCSRQIFFKYRLQRYWGCRHNQGFLNSEEKNGKSISEKLFILNNFYTQNFLHSVVWKLQNMLQKLGPLFSGWPQQAQIISYWWRLPVPINTCHQCHGHIQWSSNSPESKSESRLSCEQLIVCPILYLGYISLF